MFATVMVMVMVNAMVNAMVMLAGDVVLEHVDLHVDLHPYPSQSPVTLFAIHPWTFVLNDLMSHVRSRWVVVSWFVGLPPT